MLVPSVRARDLPPEPAEVELTASIDGVVVGESFGGPTPPPAEGDDGLAVVWDIRVALQVELCCINCRTAVVEATLTDADAREYRGAVELLMARSSWSEGCPDPAVCCRDDQCPHGLTPQLCDAAR